MAFFNVDTTSPQSSENNALIAEDDFANTEMNMSITINVPRQVVSTKN